MGWEEQLHPTFAERLGRMFAATGTSAVSGYRSKDRQRELYDGYMAHKPGYAPANQPSSSNHEYGLAMDIGGNVNEARRRAAEFGICFPVAGEPWHAQPVEVTATRYVGNPFHVGGLATTPPFGGRLLNYPPEMTGDDVRTWKGRMAQRGWRITVDGTFDVATMEVCKAFQRDKKLVEDGKVGKDTWDAAWATPVT